jgi:outer membrane protein TolC
MSRRLLAFASALVFILTAHIARAEPDSEKPVTADSLIESAYANNPELAVLETRYKALTYRVRPAGSLPDPTIGVFLMNMGAGVSFGEMEMSQFGISASQMFPYSGKRRVRRSVAQQEADLIQYDIQRKRLEIAGGVRSVYAQLYVLQEFLRLLEEQKANLKDILTALEALYVTGRTPQAELLRAQVAISRLESATLEKKRQQEALLPELARLVGSPDIVDLPQLSEPDFVTPSQSYEDLWGFVRDVSPDLGRNSGEAELERLRLKEAELDYKPDAMLMFSRSEHGKEFGPSWEVRAEITVPFWKRTKQDYRVKEVMTLLDLRARERERIVVALRQFVRSAFARLQRSEGIIDHINGALLPQADLSYESALAAYPAGKIDLASLLDALTILYDLRLQRLAFQESIWLDRAAILSRGVTQVTAPSSAMTSSTLSGRMTGMTNMGG